MGQFVIDEVRMFAISLWLGLLVGLLYDVFRAIRKIKKHGTILVAVEDLLFWLISATVTFVVFYKYNYGSIRFYVFLGMIIGTVAYFLIFSWLIQKVVKCLLLVILTIVSALFLIILLPFRLICAKMIKVLKKVQNAIRIVLSNK